MGKLLHGIYGPITGTVGNIVGSSWRGIYYIKARPKKREKPPSEKELKNRQEFGTAIHWLKPLTEYLRVGFNDPNPRMKGFMGAVSMLCKRGLIRNGADSRVEPSEVLVSHGKLPLSKNLEMTYRPESREVFIRWNTALPKAKEVQTEASDEDQLMALAYNVTDREVKGRQFGAPRFVGMQRIELGAKGPASYHVYAAFVSADRKHQSDSLYLGEVIVE